MSSKRTLEPIGSGVRRVEGGLMKSFVAFVFAIALNGCSGCEDLPGGGNASTRPESAPSGSPASSSEETTRVLPMPSGLVRSVPRSMP